jgi:hypothetical protein
MDLQSKSREGAVNLGVRQFSSLGDKDHGGKTCQHKNLVQNQWSCAKTNLQMRFLINDLKGSHATFPCQTEKDHPVNLIRHCTRFDQQSIAMETCRITRSHIDLPLLHTFAKSEKLKSSDVPNNIEGQRVISWCSIPAFVAFETTVELREGRTNNQSTANQEFACPDVETKHVCNCACLRQRDVCISRDQSNLLIGKTSENVSPSAKSLSQPIARWAKLQDSALANHCFGSPFHHQLKPSLNMVSLTVYH